MPIADIYILSLGYWSILDKQTQLPHGRPGSASLIHYYQLRVIKLDKLLIMLESTLQMHSSRQQLEKVSFILYKKEIIYEIIIYSIFLKRKKNHMLPLESNKNLRHEIHHVDLLSISSNQNSRKSLKIKINYDILSHPLVKIFEITLLLNTKLKIKSFTLIS